MKTRLEELREKLRKVDEVADACVARVTDPKDKAEHEQWRHFKTLELERAIKAELQSIAAMLKRSPYRRRGNHNGTE